MADDRLRLPLAEVANQMLLDRLAARASAVLEGKGVPHALIKGVTTARWLYDPPRVYRDVDLLVRPSSLHAAVRSLSDAGVARPTAGRLGEEASHSQVLVAPDGRELDLHVTLPTLPTPAGRTRDSLWDQLAPHLVRFPLDDRDVPALDVTARAVVLAMHYLASGRDSEQVREDFRRARASFDETGWAAVTTLAGELELDAELQAVVAVEDGGDWLSDAAPHVRLRLTDGSSAAIRLQAVLALPPHQRAAALLGEAFPTPTMLRRQSPGAGRRHLPLLYTRRWLWALRVLPGAVTQVRRSRQRQASGSGTLHL